MQYEYSCPVCGQGQRDLDDLELGLPRIEPSTANGVLYSIEQTLTAMEKYYGKVPPWIKQHADLLKGALKVKEPRDVEVFARKLRREVVEKMYEAI